VKKLKDHPVYAKYFKMMKVGLPLGAAVGRAVQDGLQATEIEAVLQRDPEEPTHDMPAPDLASPTNASVISHLSEKLSKIEISHAADSLARSRSASPTLVPTVPQKVMLKDDPRYVKCVRPRCAPPFIPPNCISPLPP
jgi:hypothetical protein